MTKMVPTKFPLFGFVKSSWVSIFIAILAGTVAWAFQVERRVSVIESHGENMSSSLIEIKSDIHDIRNMVIDQLNKKK